MKSARFADTLKNIWKTRFTR